MPKTHTNAQKHFLAAFHRNPTGPTPDQWPTPAILRRWLRKPSFRRTILSLIQSLRFQADFALATAAATASQSLTDPAESQKHAARLTALVRLSHLQRFAKARNRPDDDEDLPDLESLDDARDMSRAVERAQQAIEILAPVDRLTEDEFHDLAVKEYDYFPNVTSFNVFPPPPPAGSPYHKILINPGTLLCFLKRFNETDPHKRYASVIDRCKDLLWPDADIPPMSPSSAR